MRVPDEWADRGNLEIVVRFRHELLGEQTAALKMADLTVAPPTLRDFQAMHAGLSEEKDWDALSGLFEEMQKHFSDNPVFLNAWARFLADAGDDRFRDHPRAIRKARRALEGRVVGHLKGLLLETLALALFRNGNLEEAVQRIRESDQACPRHETVKDSIREYEEALKNQKR